MSGYLTPPPDGGPLKVEFCNPTALPACRPLPWPPGAHGEIWVEVCQIAPGIRTRQPYLVLDPEEAA